MMLDVLGEKYYLNINAIDSFVDRPEFSGTGESQHISVIKYEIIKILTEVVFSEMQPIDEKMISKSQDLSVSFRLAWNTMLFNKFIQKL